VVVETLTRMFMVIEGGYWRGAVSDGRVNLGEDVWMLMIGE